MINLLKEYKKFKSILDYLKAKGATNLGKEKIKEEDKDGKKL